MEKTSAIEFQLVDGASFGKNSCDVYFGHIEKEPHGVSIHVKGYGCCGMDDGHGAPIFIEVYEGKLRALVFADINSESPTHVIDLSGAKETARKS